MTWIFLAESILTMAILSWFVIQVIASILCACGADWARLPNVDRFMPWVLVLSVALPVATHMSWSDPVDRAFIEGYIVLALVIVAMSIYGRLFVLPRLRNAPPRTPPPNAIKAGIFRGWAPQVVRRSAVAVVVLLVAGTMSAEWILHGQAVLGGIAAGVAFIALPQVLAALIAVWLKPRFAEIP